MIVTSLAVLCAALGIGALYASWRGALPRRLALPAGWAALVLALVLWSAAANPEFGVIYGLLSMGLCAWLAVAMNYEARRRQEARAPAAEAIVLSSRGVLRNVALFLVAVVLAGVAAMLASVVIAQVLPWSDIDALVAAVLLLPVLWGLASYWACAAAKPRRPALAFLIVGALCAFSLFA